VPTTQEISIEQLVPSPGVTVPQFRIQNIREFICHPLVFSVDELRHENLWKEPRKIIKFNRELVEFFVRQVTSLKSAQVHIVDSPMA
jgi:hypothetical protein